MDTLPVSVFVRQVTAPVVLPCVSPAPADAPPITNLPLLCFSAFSSPGEGILEGNHLVVYCSITSGKNKIVSYALLDCAAMGFAFVHEQFASQHNLPRYQLPVPRSLEVIDSRPILAGC